MAYENFTLYTEVDADGTITVIAQQITYAPVDMDIDSYVYDDKGVGYFGDYEHNVDCIKDASTVHGSSVGVWGVSNSVDDFHNWSEGQQCQMNWNGVSSKVYFHLKDKGNANNDSWLLGLQNTRYYLVPKRVGTTATIKIYTDAAHTVLVDTLTITSQNTTYRYIYAGGSVNTGATAHDFYARVYNLNLMGDKAHAPNDTAKSTDAVTFAVEEHMTDIAKASDLGGFFVGRKFAIGDTAKAADLFGESYGVCKSSCATFSIIGDSYSVFFDKPVWGGEQYNLQKDLQAFNFWSGNFSIHDKGINSEPIVLSGVEIGSSACGCDHNCFIAKFVNIRTMARNNEEITISGLGNCIDAVYIIKSFSTKTMHKKDARGWSLTLEYVRDA